LQFLTSLYHRNGGSLTLNQILLGLFGFALAFVVLIVIVLVYLLKPWAIQPYGPNDSEGGPGHGANHYDALQLFFGGWAFLILLGFLTVYVVVAAKLHQRVFAPRRHNDIPKVPLEAKEPLYFCARLTILLLVLLGAFFFTMAFPAAFYRTGESFWKNPSPFAVTNWKMSASFVAKTYGDTLAFYMVLIALAVLGAGAHLVPRVKRVLHSRIRVPGVGFKYHPYPHGITCGEFVCIAAVVFLYVFWFWYFRWGYDRIVKGSAGDPHLSAQVWARVFGNISSLSFALVLFPAARNSMWVSCFGVPFERAIKHHRALGVVAYLSVTVHMCIWLGKWGVEGTLGNNLTNAHGLQVAPTHFIDAAKCEGMHPHYDNFTIIPSWVGWVLLTGMVAIAGLLRRKNYELFYYTHHFAWVYYIIALLHAWGMWMYVVGSVALYALDRWIRLTRGCVYGGAVKLSHRDGVTLIRFAHSPFGYLAGQYVFVNVPAISLTQWHPFTISSPPTQPGVEFELTVHAKDMGKGTWTHSLAELAKTSTTVEVKLDGPYGKPAPFTDRSVLILVAGGIGVTPMHALFADIYNRAVLGSGTDSITVCLRNRIAALLFSCIPPCVLPCAVRQVNLVRPVGRLVLHVWQCVP
jgi:predicted ferric reductase